MRRERLSTNSLSFAFASVSGIVAIPSSYGLKTGSIRAECGAVSYLMSGYVLFALLKVSVAVFSHGK